MHRIDTHQRAGTQRHAGRPGAGRRAPVFIAMAGILAVAGCAKDAQQAGGGGSEFDRRATAVAEAWRTAVSGAGDTWRTGFVPLDDLTVLPAPTGDTTKSTTMYGPFTLRGTLPAAAPEPGTIDYPDGKQATVPLVGAADAFGALGKVDPCGNASRALPTGPTALPMPSGAMPQPANPPDNTAASGAPGAAGPAGAGKGTATGAPGGGDTGANTGAQAQSTCTPLTVTGAKLGTTTVRTTRGVATVPAWLFTVTELAAPVARVAVAQTAVVTLPSPSVPALPSGPGKLVSVQSLGAKADNQLTFTIGIGACDRNPVGVVVEAPDVVVIGGTIDQPTAEVCTDQLKLQPVTVKLSAPLGDRVLLDGVTGRPLVS
jgi:hypothetical protein